MHEQIGKAWTSSLPEIDGHIIERARHLGAYLQATRTQDEQTRAGMHSTDEAVIAETALVDFLST